MTRLEIATRILAGICANPADTHVHAEVAVSKALLIADILIVREPQTAQDSLRDSAGHE